MWICLVITFDIFQACVGLGFDVLFMFGIIRVARVAQVFSRVVKLPRTARSIRAGRFFLAMYKIVLTVKLAAPMLLNVAIVLGLWLYMYVLLQDATIFSAKHCSFLTLTPGAPVCFCG